MARKPLVVGNWKMNYSPAQARDVFSELSAGNFGAVEVGICPTFLCLESLVEAAKTSTVGIGAQDCFWVANGAFTGRISATMLADLGVKYCLIGHSETRGKFGQLEVAESTVPYFAETDETVNLKLIALLKNKVVPILCVGETLAEREANTTDSVIANQLRGALDGLSGQLDSLVVAYEPVWAIGTGKTCDSTEAQRVCAMIRVVLGEFGAGESRVLYGGSVKPENAKELFSQEDIDGGLVGGASLKADSFLQVIAGAI